MRRAAVIALALAPGAAGQLALRGPEAPPGEAISSVSERGAFVVSPDGALRIVSWDRVLRIDGEHAADAGAYLEIGAEAWRARRRLERADAVGAEPIFDRLFIDTRAWRGPTAAVIREGLLRCRLRRGAQIGAIEPWLALLEARASVTPGIEPYRPGWAEDAGLGAVLDSQTGLAPALPPIWLPWASVRQFGAQASQPAPAETEAVAELRALYVAAARAEAGIEQALPAPVTADAGVRLVRDIVTARIGAPEERAGARARLRTRLEGGVEPWLDAWLRVAIGRSLLREPDDEARLLGVAELLAAPALHGETHAYLAGVALAEASLALSSMGRIDASVALRRELSERFPSHPALAIAQSAPGAAQDTR